MSFVNQSTAFSEESEFYYNMLYSVTVTIYWFHNPLEHQERENNV